MMRDKSAAADPSAVSPGFASGPVVRWCGVGLMAIGLVAAALPVRAAKPLPSLDPSAGGRKELATCLAKAEQFPEAALQNALSWESEGGGNDARICEATARFDHGEFQVAAQQFEELAARVPGAEASAGLWDRAGWAWLRGGVHDRAERAYDEAVRREPNDPDILIDRAFALASVEKYWDAIDDLTKAVKEAPERYEPWLYRAAAERALGNLRQAEDDIAEAQQRAPDNTDVLLLRGNLSAQLGDRAAAAAAWHRVVSLSPNSANGRMAAGNLARMSADSD